MRQLSNRSDELTRDGRARSLLALNVGGGRTGNSVDRLRGRLAKALDLLERELAGWTPEHRSRPLVAMPLVGVARGALGGETGQVIRELLDCLNQHFERRAAGARGFDVALVCHIDSDYAAVQHARRHGKPIKVPEWLEVVVAAARTGEMAIIFGAGASASLGLPLWSDLLGQLGDLIQDPDLRPSDLARLDPIDAATILIEISGEEVFRSRLKEILVRDRHALTHGLIANLRPTLAITTNYDKGYEMAAEALTGVPATVLPWQTPAAVGSARILKLHGDLDLGQIVLSRDQFVAMNAFRRPLAGVLQERLLIGHVLAVGTSMSDSTLVHAAEEVRALVKVAATGHPRGKCGTVVLTSPDPARSRLMSDTFEVVVPGSSSDRPVLLEAARDVDLFLDWLGMSASSDLSFILDARYEALLSEGDARVATLLRQLQMGYQAQRKGSPGSTELGHEVVEFLKGLGGL